MLLTTKVQHTHTYTVFIYIYIITCVCIYTLYAHVLVASQLVLRDIQTIQSMRAPHAQTKGFVIIAFSCGQALKLAKDSGLKPSVLKDRHYVDVLLSINLFIWEKTG